MNSVSVILPTFNRSSFLLKALESVANQHLPPLELILADDGSTDGTGQLFDRWLDERQPGFHCERLTQKNRGVSAARNLGARNAKGDWLAFLDSDDQWLPEKLITQMVLANEFKWIHCNEIWVRGGVRVNEHSKHRKSGGDIFHRAVELCMVSPSAALIRRDFFDQMGGFREDFPVCEDYALWLLMAAREPIGFTADRLVIKNGGHRDQLSRSLVAMDYYRVKALRAVLECSRLSEENRELVRDSIRRRCKILLNGYKKHDNFSNFNEVQGWLSEASPCP